MEASEIKEILDQHRLWLDGKGGVCADLWDADLTDANLTGANLTDANIRRANLTVANLNRANLTGANLTVANLTGANLNRANLNRANLSYADLRDANLTGANLTGAYLCDANLTNAILADISWIIPGCLVQLNRIKYGFYLAKEDKYENFIKNTFGFFIQDNREEGTFDMLAGDRIIRGIPHWVKYSGLKQIASESV